MMKIGGVQREVSRLVKISVLPPNLPMPDPQNQSNAESSNQLASPTPTNASTAGAILSRQLIALAWIAFVLVTLLAFPGHLTILACLIAVAIGSCLGF